MDGWGSFVLLSECVCEGGEFVALELEKCLSFPTNLFQRHILKRPQNLKKSPS